MNSVESEFAVNFRSAAGARAVRQRYLELLDRWPVPHERLTIPTREGETCVVACGPAGAPPVVALQGSSANAAMWLPRAADWARRHRFYTVDVIGEPGLSAPSRPPMLGETYSGWLGEVLDGLGVERADLVGVSLGAWIGLQFATRNPHRVSRFAALCPGGIGRPRFGPLLAALAVRQLGQWGRTRSLSMILGPVATGADGPEANGAGPDDPNRAVGELAMLIFANFKPRMVSLTPLSDTELRQLTMPFLAVVGDRDALMDARSTARRLAANVPASTVHVLAGIGHLLPDQTDRVLDFLGESPDQGAS